VDRRERIEARLREAFAPLALEVVDDGARHRGHAGAASGAGHYRVALVSERFRGVSRVERHRLVYEALAAELEGEIHALELNTRSPDESPARARGRLS